MNANEQAVEEFKTAMDGLETAQRNQENKAQLAKQAGEELGELKANAGPGTDPGYQANLAAAEEKLSKANADLNAAKVATKEAGAITEQKNRLRWRPRFMQTKR
ncbi:hypothetical protein [Serratia fonticola]|uniref:hypothetical protein n=1 Tax=Serratia fonticola TaxID=47917 RepID=UPI000462EE87|nr:hypothetical protein [Serratia fonticola]